MRTILWATLLVINLFAVAVSGEKTIEEMANTPFIEGKFEWYGKTYNYKYRCFSPAVDVLKIKEKLPKSNASQTSLGMLLEYYYHRYFESEPSVEKIRHLYADNGEKIKRRFDNSLKEKKENIFDASRSKFKGKLVLGEIAFDDFSLVIVCSKSSSGNGWRWRTVYLKKIDGKFVFCSSSDEKEVDGSPVSTKLVVKDRANIIRKNFPEINMENK